MSKAEPAFPISVSNDPEDYVAYPGLTKRELFAAMAMQGILARPNPAPSLEDLGWASVNAADAVLEALAALERKPE